MSKVSWKDIFCGISINSFRQGNGSRMTLVAGATNINLKNLRLLYSYYIGYYILLLYSSGRFEALPDSPILT